MKTALIIVGVLLLIYALHWIGQGTGILPWPAHTVMDNIFAFAYAGAGLGVLAVAIIGYALRRG
jgi:hypothetical protein